MEKHTRKIFSLDTILFGFLAIFLFLFTFLVPPFQKPDEPAHFYRAITYFRGQFSCKREGSKEWVPISPSVYNFPTAMKVDTLTTYALKFPVSALKKSYSWTQDSQIVNDYEYCKLPIFAYIPQIITAALTYPFDNLLVTFYAMRFINALLFLVAVFIVQKYIDTIYKGIFWLFAFTPMVLHQVSAVSYDAPSLILGMIMVALFLFLLEKKKLRLREFVGFVLVMTFFNVVKAGYYPTFLLCIPLVFKMRIRWNRWKVFGGIAAMSIVIIIIVKEFYSLQLQYIFSYASLFEGRQIGFNDPIYFFQVIIRTFTEDSEQLLRQTVGQFGWLDYNISPYVFVLYFISLGMVIYSYIRNVSEKITIKLLLFCYLVILLTIILILFGFYREATPPGFYKIVSIQGRYFLPIFPLILFSVCQTASILNRSSVGRRVGMVLVLSFCLLSIGRSIYTRYYDYSRQIINYNPLIEKIHSGGLDIQTLTSVTLDTEKTFMIPTDFTIGSKIAGFQFVPANEFFIKTPYEFTVRDTTCTTVFARGYLDRLRGPYLAHIRFPDDPVYTQYFPIIRINQQAVCVTLSPVKNTLRKNEPLKIYNDMNGTPLIRLLYVIQ